MRTAISQRGRAGTKVEIHISPRRSQRGRAATKLGITRAKTQRPQRKSIVISNPSAKLRINSERNLS